MPQSVAQLLQQPGGNWRQDGSTGCVGADDQTDGETASRSDGAGRGHHHPPSAGSPPTSTPGSSELDALDALGATLATAQLKPEWWITGATPLPRS
jgi:hypothetical protein